MGDHLRPLQPLPIRLSHWANVALLVVMAGSGLQILVAFPAFGPAGEPAAWYPFQFKEPPAFLTLGGWLAGARHWHFAFLWLFVANGFGYCAYLFASGEWRRRLFHPQRDMKNAAATLLGYLRLRRMPVQAELYNGLQRLAYTGVLVLAGVQILTGLVLFKPVQLGWLTASLGGYETARAVHFVALIALGAFTVGHVAMVALHPRTIADMTVGRRPRA